MQTGWFDLTPRSRQPPRRFGGLGAPRRGSPKTVETVGPRHRAQQLRAELLRRDRLKAGTRTASEIRAELARDGALRFRIFARDNYTCQHCRATGATAELTVDHIRPVIRGGTNADSNLQTLCRSCNSRKGAN